MPNRRFPCSNICLIERIKVSKNSASSICEVNIIIYRKACRIGRSTVYLNGVVFSGSTAVASGIVEDIVAERSGNSSLRSVKGIRSSGSRRRAAADKDAIVKEIICSQGFIDAIDTVVVVLVAAAPIAFGVPVPNAIILLT